MLFICFVIIALSTVGASDDHPFGTSVPGSQHPVYDILSEEPNHNLKLVQVVYRHGKRTPIETYLNDPFLNFTYPPYGLGQLTNEGKSDMYKLGKRLRKRYDSFLGIDYYPDIVYPLSSDTGRTKMSLLLALAGLFPPKKTRNFWNKKLNWQPIPYDYIPRAQDNVISGLLTPCARYTQELNRIFITVPEIIKFQKENQKLYNDITKISGTTYTTPTDILLLYSTLRAQEQYGLKLPEWTKKYYPNRLLRISIKSYIFGVFNDLLKKLKGGPLLSKLLDTWNSVKRGTFIPKTRKIFLYSGHDYTIANVLSAFNVWKPQYPDFNTMAIFELYEDKITKALSVKILYKTDTKTDILIIPGCQRLCPLRKLKKLVANVIPAKDGSDCDAV